MENKFKGLEGIIYALLRKSHFTPDIADKFDDLNNEISQEKENILKYIGAGTSDISAVASNRNFVRNIYRQSTGLWDLFETEYDENRVELNSEQNNRATTIGYLEFSIRAIVNAIEKGFPEFIDDIKDQQEPYKKKKAGVIQGILDNQKKGNTEFIKGIRESIAPLAQKDKISFLKEQIKSFRQFEIIFRGDKFRVEGLLPDYAVGFSAYIELLDLELKGVEESRENEGMQSINLPTVQAAKSIEPIIWTGDKVLLGYMIQWLKDNGLISQQTGRDKAIESHFVDEKNRPIKNIKQGLGRVNASNDGSLPRSYEKIEPLLKVLKPNKRKR
jgi:hypothetical protein